MVVVRQRGNGFEIFSLLTAHTLKFSHLKSISRLVQYKMTESSSHFIVGHRISHIAAYWFANTLSSIRNNIVYCSPAGDFYEKFCNLTEQSAVVAFSFPRIASE